MAGLTLTATTEAQLDADIIQADDTANLGMVTIQVTGLLAECANPSTIDLKTGNSLVIEGSGSGAGLNGEGAYRGLFVSSGNVTVENLLIEDTAANPTGAGAGGGGAGLGGGLAVASGGTVTLSGVTFTGDAVHGGGGGGLNSGGSGCVRPWWQGRH